MRSLPAVYWQVLVARWMDRAFVCRYGCQNIYQVLGRDPLAKPLTLLQLHIFAQCLQAHVEAERKPYEAMGLQAPER